MRPVRVGWQYVTDNYVIIMLEYFITGADY